MTTQGAAAGRPYGWPIRSAIWLGHYGYELLLASMAVSTVNHIAQAVAPEAGWAKVTEVTGTTLSTVALAALLFTMLVHDRTLCALDFAEAPLLDPEGAVRRSIRELRFFHNRVLFLLAAAVYVVAIPVGGWLFGDPVPLWFVLLGFVPPMLVVAYGMWATRTHRRLVDFCPFCHGRGPDDDDDAPVTPEPVVSGRRAS